MIPISLVTANGLIERDMSLYRPETKDGDPRMWIARLGTYAKPGNLIALISNSAGSLFAVNCSDPEIYASRLQGGSPLNELLTSGQYAAIAEELLAKLRGVAAMGFVDTFRPGDTGIGYTLETLLGISANSSGKPDYKGIELKSGRIREIGRGSRSTIISKAPEWATSAIKSARELVAEYGYLDESTGLKNLHVTISHVPNVQGLCFAPVEGPEYLESVAMGSDQRVRQVVHWPIPVLLERISTKHRETFWIKAKTQSSTAGVEQFKYETVTHTRSPLVNNFIPLIERGVVTMDILERELAEGGTRNHGYLFKIQPKDLSLLFPQPVHHDLN